ncbi:MAG: trypsin-like peptidase domain-containing protein [Melioribacteraceae bacterium]|nr:trypsin-like peptidase domain-containing protein [Melioribacteraceae bacterium]
MRRKNLIGTISLVFIGIVFGAILVSGFGLVRPSYADITIGATKPPFEQLDPQAEAFNNAFVNVAENVTPSIVQITVVSKVKNKLPEGFHFFFPFRDDVPREQQGGGSGIIISDDGFILTNNHVVEDASQVRVSMQNKREYDATVVGTDPLTDLAIIKIEASNLPEAYLGNSDNIKVGQWVMAIGNPLSLSSTVTAGIISATGRNINIIRDELGYGIENFIQTDAAINPGNSGGALVDLNGAVIGVNSAIATDGMTQRYIGYGFAIPINLAKSVANDLIANGKVSRGYIGVQIAEVDVATAKALGMKDPKGVIIQDIVKGGSAEKEDIKQGDIIFKVDEREVNQPNELQSYIASKRAGSQVRLTLFRDGKEIERYVTLKTRDDENDKKTVPALNKGKNDKNKDVKEVVFEELGMTVRNLSDDESKQFKVNNGVIISDVKNFGKAYNQRITRGLVITSADRKDISSVSDLQEIIESKKGQAVLLRIVDSQGTSRLVGVEIPK